MTSGSMETMVCKDCGTQLTAEQAVLWIPYGAVVKEQYVYVCRTCERGAAHLARVAQADQCASKAEEIENRPGSNYKPLSVMGYSGRSAASELSAIAALIIESKADKNPNAVILRPTIELVEQLIIDYVDRFMLWVNPQSHINQYRLVDNPERFKKAFGEHVGMAYEEIHPYFQVLLNQLFDRVHRVITDLLEKPSWNVYHVRRKGNLFVIECEADYRVLEWYKLKGLEYGASPKDFY